MSERIVAGEPVIVAKNGPFETVVTYYQGHLRLELPENFRGVHVQGWTGPETRVVSTRLRARRVFEVVLSGGAAEVVPTEEIELPVPIVGR